jgi:uncharacterized protein YecE (DUF72 family)
MVYYIGTSGYMISQKLWFSQDILNSVEVNSIFYKLPKTSTVQKWKEDSPKDMKFSVKVNRRLTHFKRLSFPDEAWKEYWDCVKVLGTKLGVILFQFPPSFHNTDEKSKLDGKTNFQRLTHLADILPKKLNSRKVRFAFEFRNTSWFEKKVYDFMKKCNWAIVNDYVNNNRKWIGNIPNGLWPKVWTADFNYVRLHGSVGKFRGSYSAKQLKELEEILKASKKKTNFVYFNNTFFQDRTEKCKVDGKAIKYAAYCNACNFSNLVKN